MSHILVVEMNMGQICQEVKKAVSEPERVFLANRIDGVTIAPVDIFRVLNLIRGKGV
jgi:2-oxoglutarate ferredoxin oxidoreductase subunit alpha